MFDLVLTLGHNSSAIAIKGGEIILGYEEERLTGKKSDSTYPINSILKIQDILKVENFDRVFISHWFADGELHNSKYCDLDHVKSLGKVQSLSSKFTHHDAHNEIAKVFAKSKDSKEFSEAFHSLVIDGFGTFGETISVYRNNGKKSLCLLRCHNYEKSLGLLFQYSTAFLGMKMHEDEYKLLGYEAHIDNLSSEQLGVVKKFIDDQTLEYVEHVFQDNHNYETTPNAYARESHRGIVNTEKLRIEKTSIENKLASLLEDLEIPSWESFIARVAVAVAVQQILENVVTEICKRYEIQNLVCSGGVFMNVKLNRQLAKTIPGKICILPLAGDQGAGLGVYQFYQRNLKWPGNLFWGQRNLDYGVLSKFEGITVVEDEETFKSKIIERLNKDGFVNIIRGNMEFGSRALCNTTTLGLPTSEVVEQINHLNNRVTVMPMAPVMTKALADKILDSEEFGKCHLSESYMITAVTVNPDCVQDLIGATHVYKQNTQNLATCRPQIIYDSDDVLYNVIETLGHPLINTSFNYHGKPIVFGTDEIIESHRLQNENGKIHTLILRD